MHLIRLAVLLASLTVLCLAVPANNDINKRQRTTIIISCDKGGCSDNIPGTSSTAPGPTTITTTTREPDPPTTSKRPVPPTTTAKPDPPTTTKKPVPPTTTAKPDPPTTTKKPVPPTTTAKPDPPKSTKPTTKKTSKTTAKPTKTAPSGPSHTSCPVPLYYQCGGWYDSKPWTGCTKCVKGAKCVVQNEFYNQCVSANAKFVDDDFVKSNRTDLPI